MSCLLVGHTEVDLLASGHRATKNHDLPGVLDGQVGALIERHGHARPHESRCGLAPAEAHHSRGDAILAERARIARRGLNAPRSQLCARAAWPHTQSGQTPRSRAAPPVSGHSTMSTQTSGGQDRGSAAASAGACLTDIQGRRAAS